MKKSSLYAFVLAFAATSLGMYAISPAEARVSTIRTASPALAPGSSYAWSMANGIAVGRVDPAVASGIAVTRLRTAVETAMTKRGYRKTHDRAAADLIVSYSVALEQQREARVQPAGATFCGWRGCVQRWPGYATVDQRSYTRGALVIDLVDRRSGGLVWRAASEKRVSAKDVSQEALTEVVMTMTKSLPAS